MDGSNHPDRRVDAIIPGSIPMPPFAAMALLATKLYVPSARPNA